MTVRETAVAYIWRYDVKRECVDAFRQAYGPAGVWFDYFSGSPDYMRTELYEDRNVAGRFVTIDYFTNAEARPALVAREADEFARIDAEWEEATLEETFVGEFAGVG